MPITRTAQHTPPTLRLLPALVVALSLTAFACSTPATTTASRDGATDTSVDADEPIPAGAAPDGAATATAGGISDAECTRSDDLPGGDVASAPATTADFPWDRDAAPVADGFDPGAIISGGPPPDGILPIDGPCFESVDSADTWLTDASPVMVLELDGDTRAYPLAILTQHEIVNDVVAGTPVVVTYCPLCNSALAFERTIPLDGDPVVHDFGTSGRLFQSNLVMYDRQTRTLWTQFTGDAVYGDLAGSRLERVPTSLLGWRAFREGQPDGLVLSRSSVAGRSYGRNPYTGYDGNGDTFLFEGPRDGRLPANTRVVGLGTHSDPIAIPLPDLVDERVLTVQVDGQAISVWWLPGQASALDTAQIDEGKDVGQTRAFVAELPDGTPATFQPNGDVFVDDQTGSTWNLLGRATAGPLEGQALAAVPIDDTFWFVWFAFQPGTRVREPG